MVADIPAADEDTAWITLELPTPTAKVWIDNVPTTATGSIRKFITPPLVVGKTYTNTVKITWFDKMSRPQQETKTFTFVAGDEIHYVVPVDQPLTAPNKAPMPKVAK
jgi:uncharacterized protein (TIGR03000 family)